MINYCHDWKSGGLASLSTSWVLSIAKDDFIKVVKSVGMSHTGRGQAVPKMPNSKYLSISFT